MTLPSFEIRALTTPGDFRQAITLQRATWGEEFGELVPPSILRIVGEVGGVAAGAFDGNGDLLGFVFGITGVRDGDIVHWSDMLAVRHDMRDGGLGRALKTWQRDRAREAGAARMLWTFDPLVARNAHVNLSRLGARVIEYVQDMYGDGSGSPLHGGLPMDRLVVEWRFDDEAAPPADGDASHEVPPDFAALLAEDPAAARRAREDARRVLGGWLADGGRIAGFVRKDGGGGRYVLAR